MMCVQCYRRTDGQTLCIPKHEYCVITVLHEHGAVILTDGNYVQGENYTVQANLFIQAAEYLL